jgi:hypothetical protein
MSSLMLGRRARGSGALLTAEAALLLSPSCCLRMEVANDREVEAFKGWARQCLETKAVLLAGSLWARNGNNDCEERIMVSRAFMRSIAREWQRPEGWDVCSATMQCGGSEIGRYTLWLRVSNPKPRECSPHKTLNLRGCLVLSSFNTLPHYINPCITILPVRTAPPTEDSCSDWIRAIV